MEDKDIPEELKKIIENVQKELDEKLDGSVGVECITENDMEHLLDTFMHYPILTMKLSRSDCDISVDKCNIRDIITVLPKAIGSLLELVPKKYRNDILYKAINEDMTDDGALLTEIKECDE